ncbi:transmembrane protein 25 [Calypte anna]|uniref:transmembrane protein 25 n=1 Tax=Calypte anna TaxID=9244 RepID=UPI0011C4A3C2|nr:transmembrane protein 25 [Calypte anna]
MYQDRPCAACRALCGGAQAQSRTAGLAGRGSDAPDKILRDLINQEAEGAGFLLVLSLLVQTSIIHMGQNWCVRANTSQFLLGATQNPGLANHSVRNLLGNFSISADNSIGVTSASLLLPGLLDARVELPLLGIAVGAALALGALLSLGSCAVCLVWGQAKTLPSTGSSLHSHCSRCSGSHPPQPWGMHPLRQTRSLPPDLHLGDLMLEAEASPKGVGAGARGEESALLELQNSLVLNKLGFVQLPTSGCIYKVPSVSSDEIWL